MIVHCPSCRTRFRHAPGGSSEPRFGRCSRCSEEFPLVPAKKSYRIRSSGAAVHAIGESLPVLAPASVHARPATAHGGSLASWTAMLLGSIGALVGYYAALVQRTDTWLWTATGCAAGLSVGALWIRWKSSKS